MTCVFVTKCVFMKIKCNLTLAVIEKAELGYV